MTHPLKAIVDADGNIMLPVTPVTRISERIEIEVEDESNVIVEPVMFEIPQENDFSVAEEEYDIQAISLENQDPEAMWTVIEDDIDNGLLNEAPQEKKHMRQAKAVWSNVRSNLYSVAGDVLEESARQYKTTLIDGSHAGADAARSLRGSTKRFWNFLKQPVWVPNKKKQPVQYSRGTLFLIDTVRFGGTFALLFSTLFAAMNYQSFSSIAYSYVEPLAQLTGIVHASDTDTQIAAKLKEMIPGESNPGEADSAEFLPPVGPPDDRLMIPKMNLNVPIVIPPMDALMAEDWKKLEDEIQAGLHDGVVHYPGTADPGKPGNFFLTGHSSYYPWDDGKYHSVFARLGELNVGDEYWVFYKGDRHRYIVSGKKEIKPADVSVLDQPIDQRISTLMTCTPVGTTLRRLIVTAQEVDPVSGKPLEVGEHAEEMPKVKMDMLPI